MSAQVKANGHPLGGGRRPAATATLQPSPPSELITIGGPTPTSWREHALTRVAELRTLSVSLRAEQRFSQHVMDDITIHLDDARKAAEGKEKQSVWTVFRSWVGGSAVERTMTNIEAVEANLLRVAPMPYLRGQMPSLVANVRKYLPDGDPRRTRTEELARKAKEKELDPFEVNAVVAAFHGARSAARREVMRVRSFRNVLLVASGLLALAAVGLAVLGILRPHTIPLCFNPDGKVVCPTREQPLGPAGGTDLDAVIAATTTGWDLPLVELVGLIAAAVSGAAALRGIRGTSTPYSLPVALAVLKLPTGALTAFLGLVLMRGQFVPGLSALDFPAQIIAWAVVFGYAQQLFTRLVDQRAQSVLDDVGSTEKRASTG